MYIFSWTHNGKFGGCSTTKMAELGVWTQLSWYGLCSTQAGWSEFTKALDVQICQALVDEYVYVCIQFCRQRNDV